MDDLSCAASAPKVLICQELRNMNYAPPHPSIWFILLEILNWPSCYFFCRHPRAFGTSLHWERPCQTGRLVAPSGVQHRRQLRPLVEKIWRALTLDPVPFRKFLDLPLLALPMPCQPLIHSVLWGVSGNRGQGWTTAWTAGPSPLLPWMRTTCNGLSYLCAEWALSMPWN